MGVPPGYRSSGVSRRGLAPSAALPAGCAAYFGMGVPVPDQWANGIRAASLHSIRAFIDAFDGYG